MTINMRTRAIELAQQGFSVFPIKEGAKSPPIVPAGMTLPDGVDYHDHIPSSDQDVIANMWTGPNLEPLNYNIGICTNDLLVPDLDRKGGNDGVEAFRAIAKELDLPEVTPATLTPTGGQHRFYKLPPGVKAGNSVSRLAPGVDVRGWHGYVVAPGSRTEAGEYRWLVPPGDCEMAVASEKAIERCGYTAAKPREHDIVPGLELDNQGDVARAISWLENNAPVAKQGQGGNNQTYQIACRVRSFGVSEPECLSLMLKHWNFEKADPPWVPAELEQVVANAYRYAQDPAGMRSTQVDFEVVELDNLNLTHNAEPEQPLPALTFDWWDSRELPEPERMCGQWLTTTTRAIVNAPTGIGKSMWTIGLGMAIATKRNFLHWQAAEREFRVLYIDGEMSNRLLRHRIRDEARRLGCRPDKFYALSHEDLVLPPLNTPQGQHVVERVIEKVGGIDLLMCDNVMSLIPGDQKEQEAWAKVMPWVKSLTKRSIGQLWVHHTGLNKERGYGDSSREWQLDTVLHFKQIERPETDVSFELKFPKARERTPATRADFRPVKVALVGDKWVSSASAEGAALDFVPLLTPEQEAWVKRARLFTGIGDDPFTRKELKDAWDDPPKTTLIHRADTLIACGAMKQTSKKGDPAVTYVWVEDNEDESE